MADPLTYIQPGMDAREKLLSADWLNAVTDGARMARRRNAPRPSTRELPLEAGEIYVRNETGADRSMFEIVAFAEPVFSRDDNESLFPVQTVMKGIATVWPDHFLSWGVLLEPARENFVARCLVQGVTVAQVNFASADAVTGHRCATVKNAEHAYLDSAPCGPARILSIEDADSGPGTKWCRLWLGAPLPTGFLARTPGGGITAASGTNFPYTPGSGSCDVAKWSGGTLVDASWNMTVYNSVDEAVGASLLIVGQFDDVGRPWVTVEPCPA